MSDPDRGSETYAYDANGNLTQSVDARGASGTVYLGYDPLNRPLWRNTTSSPTGAYVTYSYDSGTNGVGRLSSEQLNQGSGHSLGVGSYSYTYDARGQTTALSETLDGTTSPFSFGYNDAGQPTSVSYSDGTYLCDSYDSASGMLGAVSVTGPNASSGCATSGQTTLASGLAYGGDAGAAGLVTSASVNAGNPAPGSTTDTYVASYDDDLRLLSSSLSTSLSTLYQVQPGYDAASNVTALDTTLGTVGGGTSTSTDHQSFCYDEQNRLTWATSQSASGPDVTGSTTPCATNTAGTLSGQGALYTASYSYDTLDRLTQGPDGGGSGSTYTYGDPAHLHAATSTSDNYSAAYDAAGNMVCRSPTWSTTCSGSDPNGWSGRLQTYDNEGQLVGWQNVPGSGAGITDAFAYDGEGSRLAQQVVNFGVTTTTDYLLGGLEEQQTVTGGSSPGTTLTEYYPLPGIGTAVRVSSSSTLAYLAADGLGTVTEAIDTQGNVTAQQLYSPYGAVRYQSGTMPTAHGYTGQTADAATGLDDYGARYYDPVLGQFAQADTVLDGLNRYTYVGGNPETRTDPSGHIDLPPWWQVRFVLNLIRVLAKGVTPDDVNGDPSLWWPSPGGPAITRIVQQPPVNNWLKWILKQLRPDNSPDWGGPPDESPPDSPPTPPNDSTPPSTSGSGSYGPQGYGNKGIRGPQTHTVNPGITPGNKGSPGYRTSKFSTASHYAQQQTASAAVADRYNDTTVNWAAYWQGWVTEWEQYNSPTPAPSSSQTQGAPGVCSTASVFGCSPSVPIPGVDPVNPGDVPAPVPCCEPVFGPVFGTLVPMLQNADWVQGDSHMF